MKLLMVLLIPLGITIYLSYNGRSCSKGCHGCGKCMKPVEKRGKTSEKKEQEVS